MRTIVITVAMVAMTTTAAAVELPDKRTEPLGRETAAEIILLHILMEQGAWAFENGEDPIEYLAGMSPKEVMDAWAARMKAEGPSTTAQQGAAAPGEEVDAGGGFHLRNSRVKGGAVPQLIGEMVNRSGKDYRMAMFVVSLYDDGGELIGTSNAMVQNFGAGATKTFTAPLVDTDPGQIASYKVEFETGM